MSDKYLLVKLSKQTHNKLKHLSIRLEKPMTEIASKLIVDYINKTK